MLLLQFYTIIFAAVIAWLNRLPCKKMMDFGASIKEEKEWHKVNAVVKIVFVSILITQDKFGSIISMIVAAFLLLLIQSAIFDIVLSKLLHGSFWYLGKTSAMDRRFRAFFGVQEGLWKFLICCIVIVLINLFL
jgi:hypothetical protein